MDSRGRGDLTVEDTEMNRQANRTPQLRGVGIDTQDVFGVLVKNVLEPPFEHNRGFCLASRPNAPDTVSKFADRDHGDEKRIASFDRLADEFPNAPVRLRPLPCLEQDVRIDQLHVSAVVGFLPLEVLVAPNVRHGRDSFCEGHP